MVKVVDQESDSGNYWAVSSLGLLATAFNNFFLCLPQHKEACLHWLNDGEVERHNDYVFSDFVPHKKWHENHQFMKETKIRIKPKKERRWIGYCANRNQTFPHPQGSKELAWDYAARNYSYHTSEWQVIEIEVEV